MQELVEVLAKALVENPDAVTVEAVEEDSKTILKLHVAQEDMGRVIGKQGRIAKAIRTIVKSAATRKNKQVTVDIQ
ncbi:MAG: KH domain-containing protein [Selenomonadaceae bacterium]|nr:KH domain-containing protein [Selenomonadaceae bacterium]